MMSAQEYRDAIRAVGLTQVAAADFFHVNPRTSRRWAELDRIKAQDVPRAVEIALRLMLLHGLKADDVRGRFAATFAT